MLHYMYIVALSPQIVWSTYPGLYNGLFKSIFRFFDIPVKIPYDPDYEVIQHDANIL